MQFESCKKLKVSKNKTFILKFFKIYFSIFIPVKLIVFLSILKIKGKYFNFAVENINFYF